MRPPEDGVEKRPARCRQGFGLGLDLLVQGLTTDLESDLAPQGIRHQIGPHRLLHRQIVAGNPHHRDGAGFGQCDLLHDSGGQVGDLAPLEAQVGTGNQGMGLAAAEGRFQAVDGRSAAVSGKTGEDIRQHHLEALGGIGGLLKKLLRIGVDRMDAGTLAAVKTDHLAELGGEDLRVEGPLEDVRPWIAGLQYVHGFGSIV